MKHFLIVALILVVVILLGLYFFTGKTSDYERAKGGSDDGVYEVAVPDESSVTPERVAAPPVVEREVVDTTPESIPEPRTRTMIGASANGHAITAYHYGSGPEELLFIGGIHGGYAWNTALVAYELMEYLDTNPEAIPENLTVTVIPVLNPDGLQAVVGTTGRFSMDAVPTNQEQTVPGRFNGNTVDLNRNFDCDWRSEGTWQNRTVSGGTAAFSEPEAAAIRGYVAEQKPTAVVAYYSAAGGVFASNCHDAVLLETRTLTNLYANAAGYTAYEEFDFYEITGDMVNWFAKQGVPAISVLLTTHDSVEWKENKQGVTALLNHYGE